MSLLIQVYIMSCWSLHWPGQCHLYEVSDQHRRQLSQPMGHRVMC